MEEEKKLNFVSNGAAKLPPGFRFEPTEEEIVFQYLKCKVFGLPLPADVIPDIDISEYNPWDLPGEMEKDKYFFCNKQMNVMSSRISNHKASTCVGYWRYTGEERLILSSASADKWLVGLKKTMVFSQEYISSVGNKNTTNITEWNMHEYQMIILTCSSSSHCKSHQSLKNSLTASKGGWSICHIFKNKPAATSLLMTLNKRVRDDLEIDSSNGGSKLSRLNNGAKTFSYSSSMPCSSQSSISDIASSDSEECSSSCSQ